MNEAFGSMVAEVRKLNEESARIDARLKELEPLVTKAAKAAFKEMLTALVGVPNGILADGKVGTLLEVRKTRLSVDIGGKRWSYLIADVWPNLQAELPQSVREAISRGECVRVSISQFGTEWVEEMPR